MDFNIRYNIVLDLEGQRTTWFLIFLFGNFRQRSTNFTEPPSG